QRTPRAACWLLEFCPRRAGHVAQATLNPLIGKTYLRDRKDVVCPSQGKGAHYVRNCRDAGTRGRSARPGSIGLVRLLLDQPRAQLQIDPFLDGGPLVVGNVDGPRELDE